jgi:hypothetical protein
MPQSIRNEYLRQISGETQDADQKEDATIYQLPKDEEGMVVDLEAADPIGVKPLSPLIQAFEPLVKQQIIQRMIRQQKPLLEEVDEAMLENEYSDFIAELDKAKPEPFSARIAIPPLVGTSI